MRKIFFMVMALFLVTVNAFAIDDTIENRRKEAERYLKAMPPNEMFDDMATKIIVDPLVKTKNQGVFSGSYNLPLF